MVWPPVSQKVNLTGMIKDYYFIITFFQIQYTASHHCQSETKMSVAEVCYYVTSHADVNITNALENLVNIKSKLQRSKTIDIGIICSDEIKESVTSRNIHNKLQLVKQIHIRKPNTIHIHLW